MTDDPRGDGDLRQRCQSCCRVLDAHEEMVNGWCPTCEGAGVVEDTADRLARKRRERDKLHARADELSAQASERAAKNRAIRDALDAQKVAEARARLEARAKS